MIIRITSAMGWFFLCDSWGKTLTENAQMCKIMHTVYKCTVVMYDDFSGKYDGLEKEKVWDLRRQLLMIFLNAILVTQ